MKFLTSLAFFLSTFLGTAQQGLQLSNKAKVSILTCEPGVHEIYSYFGHSALRISDPENNLDKVYNYGTFDFDTPNFYLKFCRGKLLYELKSYDFKYFPYPYYIENRWIKAQVLNLSTQENQKVFDFLENNALPENKKYKYDFFFDNCATKMYEVIEKSIGTISYDYTRFPKNLTHRNLIHRYFPKNAWSKFGVDLLLGAVIDKSINPKSYMFLPDFVYQGMDKATKKSKQPLVKNTNLILPEINKEKIAFTFYISPTFIFSVLFIIVLGYTFRKRKQNTNKQYLSNSIFIIYGIVGVILLFMMTGTDHTATYWNYNILWANPIFTIFPFIRNYKIKKIIGFTSLALLIIIAGLGIQEFHFAILPIILLLLSRLVVLKKTK